MPTVEKYITRRANGRFQVVLPRGLKSNRYVGTYDTLEEARTERDKVVELATGRPAIHPLRELCLQADEPRISGLTVDVVDLDVEDLWDLVIRQQERAQQRLAKRKSQIIEVPRPDLPFALGFLSDFHIGDAGTDYIALKHDVEAIASTPRLYCGFMGDGIDNWIVGRLQRLQRDQVLQFDAEMELFASTLEQLGPSLAFIVSGNHENWTRALAGVDRIRTALRGRQALYDPYEINFSLVYGDQTYSIKARHDWKYRSVFNVTHQIEVGWERGGNDFDIGLGAHTHQGTLCRPFLRHGQMRYAILMGTYKTDGDYGRELGLASPYGLGSGALLFFPDGRRPEFFSDLQSCSEYLLYLISRCASSTMG